MTPRNTPRKPGIATGTKWANHKLTVATFIHRWIGPVHLIFAGFGNPAEDSRGLRSPEVVCESTRPGQTTRPGRGSC